MTFSIVARDEKTGQLGVAVQTHWFAVGSLCPWIEAGVGAVATQSMVEVGYGPKALNLLRAGSTAQEALDKLISEDSECEHRQVAVIDASGKVAVYTGRLCIQAAGHRTGLNYSVQANMMLNDSIWPEMEYAFLNSHGNLPTRMLAVLFAAQAAGGDIRGKQSAAILVAGGESSDEPWRHIEINLRVDDHPEPLHELKRLLAIHNAYDLMNEGDSLFSKGFSEAAMEKYSAAAKLAPEIDELPFWQAVTLAEIGNFEDALRIFRRVFQINKNWIELVNRLPDAGLLTIDAQKLHKILSIVNE